MNAGLIILRVASERRDAQNERDGAGAAQLCRSSSSVAAAAPSQQQLRRSSSSVTVAAPSEQHYNLILKWSYHRRILLEVLPAAPRHWQSLEEGRELLLLRSINSSRSSISSVAAAAGGGNVPRR